jgi:hypothetical protein
VHALIVAVRRAKGAAAIVPATRYTEMAASLTDASWWTSRYPLAHAVGLLRCECLLTRADLGSACREIDALLARNMPPEDRAAVLRLKAVLRTVHSDYEGAITHPFPVWRRRACNWSVAGRVRLECGRHTTPSNGRRGHAPSTAWASAGAQDRRIRAVMGVQSTLISSFFVTDGISFLHVAKLVEPTLEHGATPESPYGLSYGFAAMALIDHHGHEADRIATLLAIDQVSCWTQPLAYALGRAQRAVTQGLASGDVGMACYARNHIASDRLAMGLAICRSLIEGHGGTLDMRPCDAGGSEFVFRLPVPAAPASRSESVAPQARM